MICDSQGEEVNTDKYPCKVIQLLRQRRNPLGQKAKR
jgi:hypothetical protein